MHDAKLLQTCPTLCTPWTVALQASLTMGFSSKNTGVGNHFLLQGIFTIQGSNPRVLHLLRWQVSSLPLALSGKPVEVDGKCQFVVYFCFIDYTKAFDSVDHNKLWKILQDMGIPDLPSEKSVCRSGSNS